MAPLMHIITIAVVGSLVAFGWRFYHSSSRLPPVVEGFFLPEYRPVAELFRRLVEDGRERGASLAIYHRGAPLVDMWGGYADPDSRRPWRNDTLTLTFDCAKGATALVVAILVDRGVLDYKVKVSRYWPEFAEEGKDSITVEMLMSHQAGLVTLGGQSLSLMHYKHDWPRVEKMLAAAVPDYPPGERVMYHAVTLAMYVDALVRRVDAQHRSLAQFFEEEIAEPFGINFHLGLPLEQYHRAARLQFPSVLESLVLWFKPSYVAQWWRQFTDASHAVSAKAYQVLDVLSSSSNVKLNDPHYAEVGLGSLMGFGSAGSLAKLYDILANQGAAGSKILLSERLVDLLSVPVNGSTPEESDSQDFGFSQGFQLSQNVLGQVMFGHSGSGGQQSWADPTNGVGISYVTNFLHQGSGHLIDHRRPPPDHYLQLQAVFYHCFMRHKANQG